MRPATLPSLLLPPLLLASACSATRDSVPFRHHRPIVERDGRTWLWAGEDDWFEVSNAPVDPTRFQFGIGRDTIPSIDEPEHVAPDDPRLEEAGVDGETAVLGVLQEGQARAYPVALLDRHEVVNDTFGGEAFAVLW